MAEMDVAQALRITSNESLLTTYAALTHQMHTRNKSKVAKLRIQRNLVRDEILKRMRP